MKLVNIIQKLSEDRMAYPGDIRKMKLPGSKYDGCIYEIIKRKEKEPLYFDVDILDGLGLGQNSIIPHARHLASQDDLLERR